MKSWLLATFSCVFNITFSFIFVLVTRLFLYLLATTLHHPIQRYSAKVPEFGTLVTQLLVEGCGVDVANCLEHRAMMVFGIELSQGRNLAGQEQVQVLLCDVQVRELLFVNHRLLTGLTVRQSPP